jgi:large subunit ribosomal protein L35
MRHRGPSPCLFRPLPLCAPLLSIFGRNEPPGHLGLPWLFKTVARERAKETKMPKLKTKSGVKKRFKLTATGKIKHGVAGKRHRLISHNAKYIRQNRGTEVLADADTARVKAWAPYGLK